MPPLHHSHPNNCHLISGHASTTDYGLSIVQNYDLKHLKDDCKAARKVPTLLAEERELHYSLADARVLQMSGGCFEPLNDLYIGEEDYGLPKAVK